MTDKVVLRDLIEELRRQVDRLEAVGRPIETPPEQMAAIDEYIENWKENQPPPNMDDFSG